MAAKSLRLAALAGLCLALTVPGAAVHAQQAGCSGHALHDAFKFWEGTWNVYGPDGSFQGHNLISSGGGGCVLHEHWQPRQAGMDGHSLNFVDPASGAWRQIWVSSNLHIDYSGMPYGDNTMHLEGEITYFRPGEGSRSAPFRGRWQRQENGHVIQHFQQFDAGTQSWGEWAHLIYVPRGEDPNGTDPAEGAAGPANPSSLFED